MFSLERAFLFLHFDWRKFKEQIAEKFRKILSKGPVVNLLPIKLQASPRLQHNFFPVNITKCLRTPILKNICEWLLLEKKPMYKAISTWFLAFRARPHSTSFRIEIKILQKNSIKSLLEAKFDLCSPLERTEEISYVFTFSKGG